MRAPSLYEYFGSKSEIYDALFAEGYRDLHAEMADVAAAARQLDSEEVDAAREVLQAGARTFLAFCTADPARYQLMFQRPVPGYEPSEAAYRPSVEVLEQWHTALAAVGIDDTVSVDLSTALLAGLAAQQLANDPGGDRWVRLADDAIDLLLAHARPRYRP